MVTGVLFLMLVLLALVLVAFIYQILTTPLTAVDAPTLIKSAAPPDTPVPPLGPRSPAATRPALGTPPPGASGSQHPWAAAALAIAGVAAITIGGWLFLHIAPGGAACTPKAIEVCSQGFVLLTGTQLAGGAIAVAGIGALVTAIVRAAR